MLDGLSPARRRVVVLLAAVVVAVVVVAATLGFVRSRGVTPVAQDEQGPVLLVSGYGGSTGSLAPLRDALREAGHDVVVVPAVGSGTGDLDAQAEALGRAADAAMDRFHAGSVDVVGYSAGGVVARLWVRSHGGDAQARRVVSIGSPQHGTDVAALAAGATGCPTACRQLDPDSPLLRKLNAGDETPRGPRWFSLWSTADRTVVPPSSARLDGATDETVQDYCPDARTSHGGLPGDDVVHRVVEGYLGPGHGPGSPQCLVGD